MSMIANVEDDESPMYADKYLQVLIKEMDDPFAHWDENLLAAVIILRLQEKLSHDDDRRCHLFGARRILDSVSAFAADGGLREAASWLSTRQHIYVSLTEQQPLDINLVSTPASVPGAAATPKAALGVTTASSTACCTASTALQAVALQYCKQYCSVESLAPSSSGIAP
ncbi:hypothetical protein LTR70_010309 [Exophiala xenobiotica]|uniref:Uncharacterized protein n=1 Tax=Lithohypha guttulata TaxID=1690604 RepID=A0ABR0JUB3_9EURO|nr:hypothetical protein LTR24_010289 [Lithohypha guttulata]KAK5309405.1 hypothetical protein LTR70_010309 [Exophiala xenobiotica]